MLDLQGKTALVTGGSKGIGLAITKKLHNAKAKVIVVARNKPNDFSNEILFIQADFTDLNSISSFLKNPLLDNVDILINNAGINRIDSFANIPEKDFDEIMQVNLKLPFLLTQKVLINMKKNNYGRIVNIASIFSHISKEFRGSYSASKFGLVGMTKSIAIEYASNNILCNTLSPGFINTELTNTILSQSQINDLIQQVPMKRLGTPDEIANAVLFLSSSENTFITGQNIIADGGFSCV